MSYTIEQHHTVSRNMAKKEQSSVSISEAARLTGKGRQTLYRHIKAGKVSAITLGDSSKVIPIVELERVYGLVGQVETVSPTVTSDAIETPILQAELNQLKADNERLTNQVSDLRRDKEWLQKLVDDLTIKRLPSPMQSVWSKLFGTDSK